MSRPERYKSREVNGMDVIDLIKYWGLNFNEGNILKYLLRDKGEDASDMNKIADYAQREEKYLLSDNEFDIHKHEEEDIKNSHLEFLHWVSENHYKLYNVACGNYYYENDDTSHRSKELYSIYISENNN